MEKERDVEKIKSIIAEAAARYQVKGGDIQLAGIEGDIVKIVPSGFCWR